MDKFEASNGVEIKRTGAGLYVKGEAVELDRLREKLQAGSYGDLTPAMQVALREFFRAERDEELGRWRLPENPDYVVYPTPAGGIVNVLKESNGHSGQFDRQQFTGMMAMFETSDPAYSRAARAYFDAHPEPKPWDNAQRDEVWLFKSEGNGRALAWRAEDGWDVIDQRGNYHKGIQDVPAEMVAHSFYGWENATAERMEVSDAVD